MIVIDSTLKEKPKKCKDCKYMDKIKFEHSTNYHCTALLLYNYSKLSNVIDYSYHYWITDIKKRLSDCPLMEVDEK